MSQQAYNTSTQNLFEYLVRTTVVEVHCGSDVGTGFFVLPDHIVTCYHVIRKHKREEIKVLWNNKLVKVSLIKDHSCSVRDIAVLSGDFTGEPSCLPLGGEVNSGDEFYTHGFQRYKLGYRGFPIRGSIVGITKQVCKDTGNMLNFIVLADSLIEEGLSGSPLFNLAINRVIGIIKRSSGSKGGGYAIPISALRDLWEDLFQENARIVNEQNIVSNPLKNYLSTVGNQNEYLQMIDLKREIRLEEVYVTLTLLQQAKAKITSDSKGYITGAGFTSKVDYKAWSDRGRDFSNQNVNQVSLTEALSYNQIVFLGDPGAGKTTLLRHLAYKLAVNFEQGDFIPVFVRLADLSKAFNGSLFNLLDDRHLPYSSLLKDYLQKGKCIILFDGLDEVPREDLIAIQSEIRRVEAWQNKVIVASRTIAYPSGFLPSNYQIYEVVGFNRRQQEQFLLRWFDNDPIKAHQLLKAIQESQGMRGLAENPLLLSLMAVVSENDPNFKLPTQRIQLYERSIELLLDRWRVSHGIASKENLSKRGRIHLLRKIALDNFLKDREIFTEDYLLDEIEKFQQLPRGKSLSNFDSEFILGVLSIENGILSRHAETDFRFLHLTFQEYFTACALSRRDGYKDIIEEHLIDPQWEEVIRLFAGLLDDATEFITFIWNENVSDDVFYSRLFLAGRCLGDVKEVSDATAEKIYKKINQILLDANLDTIVRNAIYALSSLSQQFPEALNPHIANLQNEDERTKAIETLGNIGNPHATPYLINFLSTNQLDIKTTRDIIYALGNLRDVRVNSALLDYMLAWEPNISTSSSEALSAIRDINIVQRLIDLLKHENETVRLGAVHVLSNIEPTEAIPSLVKTLTKADETDIVRDAIENALIKISDIRDLTHLIDGLDSNDYPISVKISILRVLGNVGKNLVKDKLLHIISDTGQPLILRCATLEAITESGITNCPKEFLELLQSSDEIVIPKELILGTLDSFRTNDVEDIVISYIADDNQPSSLRRIAILSASKTKNSNYADSLVKVIESPDVSLDLQIEAVNGLGDCGSYQNIATINSFLAKHFPNPLVRRVAYASLGNLGGQVSLETLRGMIHLEDDASVFSSWIDAITKFEVSEVEGILAPYLTSQKFAVGLRAKAALALGQSSNPQILEILYELLSNPHEDKYVQDFVVSAIQIISRKLRMK